MGNPTPPHRDLVREVRREFRRVRKEIEPGLIEQAQTKPHLDNPEMRNIVIAQNVLRVCMEATFDELLPYSHLTALEIAVRIASYALSVAPMEDQEKLVSLFMQSFPNAHDLRLALGIVISTTWDDGKGKAIVNHPAGPITNPKGNV